MPTSGIECSAKLRIMCIVHVGGGRALFPGILGLVQVADTSS